MQDLCEEIKMESGFIRILLACLAESLLPSLLGGKGLCKACARLEKEALSDYEKNSSFGKEACYPRDQLK